VSSLLSLVSFPISFIRAREALWVDFQASVSTPPQKSSEPPQQMVKIEKRYLFAGKEVMSVFMICKLLVASDGLLEK